MDLSNLDIQKEIERSYDVEREIRKNIDKEVKTEEEILEASLAIADNLLNTPKVKAIIDERQYLITMRVQPMLVKKIHMKTKEVIEVPEDHIVLIIADIAKYNLSAGKYIPFTAKAQVDKDYSLRDNLKTVVEGFIRHITGNIKPEILE